MKIGLAQINAWLGDFQGNAEKILKFVMEAHELKCDLVVFPEAALFGYHPCDLLERHAIVEAQMHELRLLHRRLPAGIAVLVGAIVPNSEAGKAYQNVAVFLERGRKPKIFAKQLLPTYDVFDEGRHIEPGRMADNVFKFKGKSVLVTICEDMWGWQNHDQPGYAKYAQNPLLTVKKSVDLVLNLSASPFTKNKLVNRRKVARATAKHFKCPLVYVNMVGAQDELIFDGGSFVVSAQGEIKQQADFFREDLRVFSTQDSYSGKIKATSAKESLRQALVNGIRDFVFKNSFKKVHLGLSGGIDSAVVACLAAEAVGPESVSLIAMPGPFSSPMSLSLAKKLAGNLGIKLQNISIDKMYHLGTSEFAKAFGVKKFSVMHENMQARLRAFFLMAYANQESSLLLATSNKSELATGYSTLYGDMSGSLMPIGDLLKKDVVDLAWLYNEHEEVIPKKIITRAPSAELRPHQKDSDSLPPYAQLDKIVEKLVEKRTPARSKNERQVLQMLLKSEFKRWQAPPILKVTEHAFGRGRRFPLAHKTWV